MTYSNLPRDQDEEQGFRNQYDLDEEEENAIYTVSRPLSGEKDEDKKNPAPPSGDEIKTGTETPPIETSVTDTEQKPVIEAKEKKADADKNTETNKTSPSTRELEKQPIIEGKKQAEKESTLPTLVDDPLIVQRLKSPEQKEEIEKLKPSGKLISQKELSEILADFVGMEVYLHYDEASALLCEKLNARAFAYDNHIFLGKDEYKPGTDGYNALMAHELTHVASESEKLVERQVAKDNTTDKSNAAVEKDRSVVWEEGFSSVRLTIKSKADLLESALKEVNNFLRQQPEARGKSPLPVTIYYKNDKVASGEFRYSTSEKYGYQIELNKKVEAFKTIPEVEEKTVTKIADKAALITSEKTIGAAQVDPARYNLRWEDSRKIVIIESIDSKKPITVDEVYLIIHKKRTEIETIKRHYPKRSASETSNGKTAPKYVLDGLTRGYYFPDEKTEKESEKDKYKGELVNKPGIVEAELGIRLHRTPSPYDSDYSNKKNIAQNIYSKGTQVTIINEGNKENENWLYIRVDGKEGWIQESHIALSSLNASLNKSYLIKAGDTPTKIVQNEIKGITKETGYDDRTLVQALYLLNKDKGVKINQEKLLKSREEKKVVNAADPALAETRAVFQSAYVVLGANLLIPTKSDVDRLISEGKIGSRPEWMNIVVEGGKSVIGFQKGYYLGIYEAGKSTAGDSVKLIIDILTGEIIGQVVNMATELWKLGPSGVWDAIQKMIGGSYDDFVKNWNNPNPEQRWEYMGKIVGMIAFEVAIGILSAGAGSYIKNIPKIKKVLDKLPKLKDIITKKTPEIEKGKAEAIAPLDKNKKPKTDLGYYGKLTKKLSVLSKEDFAKFDKYLRTLPEDVLKKLDAEPELVEEFAKRALKDAEFAEAVRKGDLSKLDVIREKVKACLLYTSPSPRD